MKKIIKSITAFALATACICGGSFITSNNANSSDSNVNSINEVHAASAFTYAYAGRCDCHGVITYKEYYQGRPTGVHVDEGHKYLKCNCRSHY